MANCVSCGDHLLEGRYYYCGNCFDAHKEDILSKQLWIKFLSTYEKKHNRKQIPTIRIEDNMDIDDAGNLIIYKRRRDG